MKFGLKKFGGLLRCMTCGREDSLGDPDARVNGEGWPRCCGQTMRWITERQLREAGRTAPKEGK